MRFFRLAQLGNKERTHTEKRGDRGEQHTHRDDAQTHGANQSPTGLSQTHEHTTNDVEESDEHDSQDRRLPQRAGIEALPAEWKTSKTHLKVKELKFYTVDPDTQQIVTPGITSGYVN